MKLGYPYYYDDECSDIAYFSDSVVSNSHVFFIGLIVGISSRHSFAFAEDVVAINPFEDPGVIPARMGKGRMNNMGMRNMNQMEMLNRKQIAARLVALSACGSAAKCVPDLTEKAVDKGSKNPKTVAVIGCIFIAGWCAGQIVDRVLIDRLR